MAMTVDQVERLIGSATSPQGFQEDDGLPPTSGSGGSGPSGPPDWQYDDRSKLWYDANTGDVAPQWIQDQLNKQMPGGSSGGIRPPGFERSSGAHTARGGAWQDDSGIWRDTDGSILPQWMQRQLSGMGPGGGGGGGFDTGPGYLDLANRQFAFESGPAFEEDVRRFGLQYALEKQRAQQGFLADRAGAGLGLGDLVRGLSNDQYQRALDPGNFPAYLASIAGLEGTGGPISQLLGEGATITPPEGGNPLADPRFSNLLNELYGFANPTSLQTVMNLAEQHGGTLPPEFYQWTQTQPPEQFAEGGEATLQGPHGLVNLLTGDLAAIAGEAGPERLTFDPVHEHDTEGMKAPHQHDGGDQEHEHDHGMMKFAHGGAMNILPQWPQQGNPEFGQRLRDLAMDFRPNQRLLGMMGRKQPRRMNPRVPSIQRGGSSGPVATGPGFPLAFADGGSAVVNPELEPMQPGGEFTPSQGTNYALWQALQASGYGSPSLLQQLQAGRAPTPGAVGEDFQQYVPPSLAMLMQSGIRSQVGSAGLMDFLHELEGFRLPGIAGQAQVMH